MNPNYSDFDGFPAIKETPWNKVFVKGDALAIDLVSKLIVYTPSKRLSVIESLKHEFFDELRNEDTTIGGEIEMPKLFSFTKEELIKASPEDIKSLIPEWAEIQRPDEEEEEPNEEEK